MLSALFDDHYETFVTWREAGLSGLTCVHVDAHLDVSVDGFTEASLAGIAQARNREELAAFRGNPKLPWGGFHCGNYLYPALRDGTVSTLIWVVPADFGEGSFLHATRQTLQSWVDLPFEEYRSLKMVSGRAEGVLFGRRLVVCTSDTMPELSPEEAARVALDIDVDYFISIGDDRMWQTPHQLRECLGDLQPIALTVATSCEGGYTPLFHRCLGEVCLEVFGSHPDAWREETAAYQAALHTGLAPVKDDTSAPSTKPPEQNPQPQDDSPDSSQIQTPASEGETPGPETEVSEAPAASAEELAQARNQALSEFLERAPDVFKPSVLCALGRFEEAEAMDPRYRRLATDTAGRLFQKRRYAEALACLDEAVGLGTDAGFLTAFLALGNAQTDLSLDEIDKLLAWPGLTDRDIARLLALQAEVLGDRHPKKAIEALTRSLKIEPNRAHTHYLLAQHQRELGLREQAAKNLRKALRLARGKLSSLPMLLDASRLYDTMGQKAMAHATRRELEDSDVTGFYAIKAVLDTAF